MIVSGTIIDEGAYVSILSSTAWKVLGSLPLVPITQNMLAFNRGSCQPLGIVPQLPITLGGKIVYLNVMVVPVPLDYNLLLGRNYVYDMGAIVSALFQVICLPHEGRIVIVDQLSLPCPKMASSQPSSLNGPFFPMVSSLPRVNYVSTRSMPTSTNDEFHDVVHYVAEALVPDLSDGFLTMYPFQIIVLPSDENLLEVMTSYGS